jgi:hypoxanthine phosphoribosyltransferase
MDILWLNLRDEKNNIIRTEPQLIGKNIELKNKKILLVDDVSRTGKTLEKAKQLLNGNEIKNFSDQRQSRL